MWTLLKEESRRWLTSACHIPKALSRYVYPARIGPHNYSSDLQHRLQRNDIEAYTESAQNLKHVVNYRQSKGSYLKDADGNTLLNFDAKHNALGYNHSTMIHVRSNHAKQTLKQRHFDNHINQAINVHHIQSQDYHALKYNVMSIVNASEREVVFTESSGSLALNLVAIVARQFKAKDLEVSPHEISFITFKGDNNGDSLAFGESEELPESRIELELPQKGESAARLAQIESLFSSNSNIGVVFIEGFQTLTGEECDAIFYQELQRLCLKYKVFLAVNEIESGFGASGDTWWAHQKWQLDQAPQFIIFGGRTQTAGFFAPASLVELLDLENRNEKVDMVGVVKMSQIIDTVKKNGLLGKISARGQQMKEELKDLSMVDEVKGKGVNITLQLNRDVEEIRHKLHQKGICTGRGSGNTLVLQPDYEIGESEITSLKQAMKDL